MSKANASICVMIATTVTVMTLFFWPKPEPRTLQTAVVTLDTLTVSCMLEGRAVYGDRQVLLAPVDGLVAQCYARSGDPVESGELILRMDSRAEEASLAALESQSYQLLRAAAAVNTSLPAADVLLSRQQHLALSGAIESKQIRTDATGIVENLYVQSGEYVAAGTPLGQIRGERIQISAFWNGDSDLIPAAGMKAYWCAADGTPECPLLLENISLSENNGYLLTFSLSDNAPEHPGEGETAPVRLLMKELSAMPLIPERALDDRGRVWVIQSGRVIPVQAETAAVEQGYIQATNLLPGTRIILDPDRENLSEGERIRYGVGL